MFGGMCLVLMLWISCQAIDRLSIGDLSTDVESMRTKTFDKCIKNEMEEDMQKEFMELRQDKTTICVVLCYYNNIMHLIIILTT
jgi:hypothetical protein